MRKSVKASEMIIENYQTTWLQNFWMNMTNDKVYQQWPGFAPYQALFNKSGVLDNTPLLKTVTEIFSAFNGKIHRKLLIGATGVDNGHEFVFDSDDITDPHD